MRLFFICFCITILRILMENVLKCHVNNVMQNLSLKSIFLCKMLIFIVKCDLDILDVPATVKTPLNIPDCILVTYHK